jgi:GT2 family glycosyltransferase
VSNDLHQGQEAAGESIEKPATPTQPQPAEAGMPARVSHALGIVVIGRNEGERLKRCLESLGELVHRTVYVDSGSSDDSVALSLARGASVLELDPNVAFSAARARNEGFKKLLEQRPTLEYVFFVDGDCEVLPGWLPTAIPFLEQHPQAAAAWGHVRERHPEQSIYNLLCDLEWKSFQPGETPTCGGNAVMRVAAFRQANGFRAWLICGEEPELAVRLRQAGWRIWHLDTDMVLHDASLHRFSQWWTRALRGGYAYAQGAHLHGKPPERHWVAESRSIWSWGLWIPLGGILGILLIGPWAVLAFLIYPVQVVRIATKRGRPTAIDWLRASALVLGKFPEMLGQVKFTWALLRRMDSPIIEYK